MSSTNPNSHRLTDHDICVVESFNHIIRHQNAAAALLEQLLEYHQANDTDENTQAAMASVFTALQNIAINDSSKSALDDFGQKWNHNNDVQFELNRRFTRAHNPDDESMSAGPGIYDNYKRQVNTYGETSVYKRDCGQLVPKPTVVNKTDWNEGSAVRTAKSKKQVPQQQMTVAPAPAHPQNGRGNGGDRRSIHLPSQAPRSRLPQCDPKTSWSHVSPKCTRLWFPGKGTRNMAPQVPGLFYSCKM
jgi:hypothetical protein